MDRREFLELMGAAILIGAASIGYDATVNGGRPAESSEEKPQEKPPH